MDVAARAGKLCVDVFKSLESANNGKKWYIIMKPILKDFCQSAAFLTFLSCIADDLNVYCSHSRETQDILKEFLCRSPLGRTFHKRRYRNDIKICSFALDESHQKVSRPRNITSHKMTNFNVCASFSRTSRGWRGWKGSMRIDLQSMKQLQKVATVSLILRYHQKLHFWPSWFEGRRLQTPLKI